MRALRVFVNNVVERNVPDENAKTGWLVATATVLDSMRFLSDSNGQTLESLILKMSTNWQAPFLLFFGNLTWTTPELSEVKEMQSQVRVSMQKLNSLSESNSPIQNEPKNATQHADQKTRLLFRDQSLFATSCPRIFRRGNYMASRLWLTMPLYMAKFSAPLNIALQKKSLNFEMLRPLSLWAIFRSDMYSLTVAGDNLLEFNTQLT
jgi:hypothetical protein